MESYAIMYISCSSYRRHQDMVQHTISYTYTLFSITCDPVTMTVFPRFSNMNESAEAVYANVSVPWRMTKPSYAS
jgi:hypothetical protein